MPYTFNYEFTKSKNAATTHCILKKDTPEGKAGKIIEPIKIFIKDENGKLKEVPNYKERVDDEGTRCIFPTSETHFFLKIKDLKSEQNLDEIINPALKDIEYEYRYKGIDSKWKHLSQKDIESVIDDIKNNRIKKLRQPRIIDVVVPKKSTIDKYKPLREEVNAISEYLGWGDSFIKIYGAIALYHKNKELIKYFKKNTKGMTEEIYIASVKELQEALDKKELTPQFIMKNFALQKIIIDSKPTAAAVKREKDAIKRVKKQREKEKEENSKKGIVPKPKGRPKKEK